MLRRKYLPLCSSLRSPLAKIALRFFVGKGHHNMMCWTNTITVHLTLERDDMGITIMNDGEGRSLLQRNVWVGNFLYTQT
jgi:hypothetical protein